jgi:hypothetical protein
LNNLFNGSGNGGGNGGQFSFSSNGNGVQIIYQPTSNLSLHLGLQVDPDIHNLGKSTGTCSIGGTLSFP